MMLARNTLRRNPELASSVRQGFRAVLPSARSARGRSFYSAGGFSLLELMLVLFILGLLATTALVLTEGSDDQARYDETKRRLERIKHAIVGDPTRTVNGSPEISGYVADMGRLPGCLKELLVQETCAGAALPGWQPDAVSGIWAGWRGPYVHYLPERDGPALRDGWGNPDQADPDPNYGWTYQLYDAAGNETGDTAVAVAVSVQSLGEDGAAGGDANTFNADYPADGVLLVGAGDFKAHMQGWDAITLRLNNRSGAKIAVPADSLRLKLSHAEDGGVSAWPATAAERDADETLSATFPEDVGFEVPSLSEAGKFTVPAHVPPVAYRLAEVGTNYQLQKTEDGVSYFTIAEFSNTTLTPANPLPVGDTTLPAGTVVAFSTGLNGGGGMTMNMGSYSIIVACESDGSRFDGSCPGTSLNTPHFFNLAPRMQPLAPPSPLIWNIE